MRKYLVPIVVTVSAIVAHSQSAALQVVMSSPRSSFVQGEPVYVWVDYYNETATEIGLPKGYLFGFDVLKVQTRDGAVVSRAGVQADRAPLGGSNQVERVAPKEHVVFFANLLEHVNLTDAGDYVVQIFIPNHAPELFLDQKNPAMPASHLVHGPIQSNRWEFTIAPGNGEAFELVSKPLRDKTSGTFGLCQNAPTIVEKYPNSAYGPYAVMCELDRLLYGEGQGPEKLPDRLKSAEVLIDRLRRQPGFEYLNIALLRYPERLTHVGQKQAAAKLLSELQQDERLDVARLYLLQLRSNKTESE